MKIKLMTRTGTGPLKEKKESFSIIILVSLCCKKTKILILHFQAWGIFGVESPHVIVSGGDVSRGCLAGRTAGWLALSKTGWSTGARGSTSCHTLSLASCCRTWRDGHFV
jgi:hypothetical protein